MVLRITRVEAPAHQVTLMLDGRLVDPWAELVERECAAVLESGRAVAVDLSGVAVVDGAGIETLSHLDQAGVPIQGCSELIASILSDEGIHAERMAS